jgi:hypothetical protein
VSAKSQAFRVQELDDLKGGTVSSVRRAGDVLTARVTFKTSVEAITAASRLQRKGWGASLDGKTVRVLVVVA